MGKFYRSASNVKVTVNKPDGTQEEILGFFDKAPQNSRLLDTSKLNLVNHEKTCDQIVPQPEPKKILDQFGKPIED